MFGALGALQVHRDGAQLRLPSARQRALLAALLIGGRAPVSADALIEAVWGTSLPASPRSALHTLLSRLRRTLGANAIIADTTGYCLRWDSDAFDVARFEMLRTRSKDSGPREAADLLAQALALWRGRAYAEVADREFAAGEAARLEELRRTCVEDRAQRLLELDDGGAAVVGLEPLLREEPLRERALALLMKALYRSGRHTEALDRYRTYRQSLADELGLDPSPALGDLEQRILAHDLPAPGAAIQVTPARTGATWLATDGPFVGREHDTTALVALVQHHRLVTVTGMGGVGKTRLVAEALPRLLEHVGLHAAVVELATIHGSEVTTAIASSLGIGATPEDVREATLEYLSVAPVLLILDNCEHVLTAVHSFLDAALARCPNLRVVATSRRRMDHAAEQVLPIDPLPVHAPDDVSAEPELVAATQLFVGRVRRLQPRLRLSQTARVTVIDICRRLDGLPLAIELAATRAASLGVDAVRERLAHSFDLLGTARSRDDGSLRATLDWSVEQLDEDERAIFAALSVFEGPFTLDAAEQVAAGVTSRPVAVSLAGLVDASLLSTDARSDHVRYRMLAIIRHVARDRLAAPGIDRDVRLAHARWVRSMVQAAADTVLGPGGERVAASLDAEAPNIRAGALWAANAGEERLAGEITGALVLATTHTQLRHELIELVRRVAEHPGVQATPAASLALAAGGFAAVWQGDLDAGEQAASRALPMAATPEDRFLALCTLGIVTLYRGDHDTSRHWWHKLLAVDPLAPARRLDPHASLALIATYAGDFKEAQQQVRMATACADAAGTELHRSFVRYVAAELAATSDIRSAVPLLNEAVAEADRAGAEFTAGLASTALVAALTRLGRRTDAATRFATLLPHWLRLAAWPQLWTTLRLAAELLAAAGRHEAAALPLAAADGAPGAPAVTGDDVDRYARLRATLRAQLGQQRYDEILTMAVMLPRAGVVDRTLSAVTDLQRTFESAGERHGGGHASST